MSSLSILCQDLIPGCLLSCHKFPECRRIPALALEGFIVPSWSNLGSLTALVNIKEGFCLSIFLRFLP